MFKKILLIPVILFSLVMILLTFIGLLNISVFETLDLFCHQNPERCFAINGKHFGTCGRCFGIYVGMFTFGLFSYFFKLNKFLILISVISVLVNLIFKFNEIETNNTLRFIGGFFNTIIFVAIAKNYFVFLNSVNRKLKIGQ